MGYVCKVWRGAETGARGNTAERNIVGGFVTLTHGQAHASAVTGSKHDRMVPRHAAVS